MADTIINQVAEQLADFIQLRDDLAFKMRSSRMPEPHVCGTAGCIGGFAAALWKEELAQCNAEDISDFHFSPEATQEKLKLDDETFSLLCYPEDFEADDGGYEVRFKDTDEVVMYRNITRKGAIATLRRLARTGEVVWFEKEQEA